MFKPGDRVTLVRGISELEKDLIAKSNVHFKFKRYSKPHGYAVVGNESGDWHLHPEALELEVLAPA